MKTFCAPLAFVSLVVATPAFADVIATANNYEFAAPPPSDHGPKSEDVALGLSIGGALVGPAMIGLSALAMNSDINRSIAGGLTTVGLLATLVGPSAGHFYAGRGAATPLLVLTTGIAIASVGALVGMFPDFSHELSTGDLHQSVGNWTGPGILIGIGAATYIAGTVLDIATSRSAVRQANREHHVDLQVTPMMSRTTAGNTTGVALTGSF